MLNKNLLIGLGCMLVGAALVIAGLSRLPAIPIVSIVMGGAVGFSGYKIFEKR